MKYMTEFEPKEYNTLLARNKIDASKGVLFDVAGAGQIPPDTHNRTILIGMGGTGIKTIDYVKRSVDQKLSPNWKQYVAFLGIDADWHEIDRAGSLTPSECVLTTLNGIAQRAQSPASYPQAWRTFADHNKVMHLANLGGAGSGRVRLMGKMKLHDKDTGSAVDQSIVQKLTYLKANVLSPIAGSGHYEVYVIGSVSGGTCSGGFLEMPALVRKALGVNNVRVHAMLYLPDTVAALDPANQSELEANGYASLKELNYFQGMGMRRGYSETWSYNDPAEAQLTIHGDSGFFEMPYLVGTAAGPAQDSSKVARETIAEFFVSILGNVVTSGADAFLVDQFLNNAVQHVNDKNRNPGNAEMEAQGELHDFPKMFGAIGFAAASAPKQIVKAYAVGKACDRAGLKPVTAVERATMIAKGDTFLPFLGEDEYLVAGEGTAKAELVLKPLLDFLKTYQKAEFNFLDYMSLPNVTFKEIRENKYDSVLQHQIAQYVKSKTGDNMKKELDQALVNAFAKFRDNVKNYVKEYGPLAFYNLYCGTFIPENNFGGVGIKQMLANIYSDKDYKTGSDRNWRPVADAYNDIVNCKQAITNANPLNLLLDRQGLANNWLMAVNNWSNLCVNEQRRAYVLGNFHAIYKQFVGPTAVLADQMKAFGHILNCLADTYQEHGEKLNDFNEFRKIQDNATEVNIAAVNTAAHSWLHDEADRIAQIINGEKVRAALVDSFFENTEDWLKIDDSMIEITARGVHLTNPDMAVAARQMFDKCMQDTISVNMDVSIENLFNQVQTLNVNYDQYAQQIIDELSLRSQTLFNGTINGNLYSRYIMYPQSLTANNPAIVQAIQNAAAQKFPGIGFYGSAYADSIAMYQLAAPFEVYRLNELNNWERQYNLKMHGNNGLHGRTPDLRKIMDAAGTATYVDNSDWHDYPAITAVADPTQPNADGEISHEGQVRIKINKLLEEARKLGVLYSQQDANGKWSVCRVNCDKRSQWSFNESLMIPDNDGLLPTGKALAEAVANQNGKMLADMSRVVELHNGGLMNETHTTEDWAWYYAKRVLYVHRPMLVEIRETVEKFRVWGAQVDEANKAAMQKWQPAKMIRIMQAHLLYKDDAGYWKLEGQSATAVANLSESGLNRMRNRDPQEAALVDGGFELFCVYRALVERADMKDGGMDKLLAEAKQVISDWLDEEVLDQSFAFVDKKLKEESELLEKLGGNLASPEKKPLAKFVTAMAELDIDESKLTDLCRFYSMAKLWKKV